MYCMCMDLAIDLQYEDLFRFALIWHRIRMDSHGFGMDLHGFCMDLVMDFA